MEMKSFLAIMLFMEFVMSFSPMKEHEGPKEKVKESVKELIFPDEGPIKIYRDDNTNEILWEDSSNLIDHKKRKDIESYIQLGGELSNTLFDSISCWYVSPDSEAIPFFKELILRISADVDLKNTENRKSNGTIMMFAVKWDVDKAVLKLMERGAKIEAVDKFGCNCLHWAAFYRSESCLKVLLQKCKTIDTQDTFGNTALMVAAQRGSREILKILLQTGANIKIKDKNGKTAYQLATKPCSKIIAAHEANLKN